MRWTPNLFHLDFSVSPTLKPTPQPAKASGDWIKAWHVNPTLANDYDVIDGLRGMAILMVVAFHLVHYLNPKRGVLVELLCAVIGSGNWGVTIFFALSGFLISHPFWKRKMQGLPVVPNGYAKRRFWKIYPPSLCRWWCWPQFTS